MTKKTTKTFVLKFCFSFAKIADKLLFIIKKEEPAKVPLFIVSGRT